MPPAKTAGEVLDDLAHNLEQAKATAIAGRLHEADVYLRAARITLNTLRILTEDAPTEES